ncbi:ParB/RepB/Spo0J family partition protein [Paracoccus sp. CPCC 101403]|uniref:ParB/RepB/Spo0J family partition protein n=1 Tax=Paracoccus broussonetiae TaxID=3075834 RepID=A0ABU3EJD9_9RHOB|nr:ParB/RepB/Spo0J family partition protein [Paracoccus sp. CPCC 101403]MDT1064191.1 ParB/RepB/Spo0J family partition protein [Paracoccus sp. CPCC 101403]
MKHDTITSPLEQVPFAELYVSDLNPRTMFDPAGIETLAANIRQLGLIQNLAGLRDQGGKIGIVAGGRRLRALALLQDDARFATVPVRIAPDQATAQTWASSENHQREQPHPADEIREYASMAARGVAAPAIALAFGATEAHVYRRLRLAALPVPVLDALKAGEITLANAAAFTISGDEAQSLAVLDRVRGQGFSDHQIKQMLKSDSVRNTDRRAVFVGQEAYEAAGGRVTADLFADQAYFEDVALLDDLFTAELDGSAERFTAEGWKWAEPIRSTYLGYHEIEERKLDRLYAQEGDLTEAETERCSELVDLANGGALDDEGEAELAALQAILDGAFSDEQRAVSGVLFHVDQSGTLNTVEGLVKREDRAAAIKAGLLRPSGHTDSTAAPKSPISNAPRDDLGRVAMGARQHAILRDPDLLLDLLAYQLSHGLHWRKPFGLATEDVPNWPSTEAEGYVLDERLAEKSPRDMYGKELAKSFRAFRQKAQDHKHGELIRCLAALFRGGDEQLSALIDKETSPQIRDVWTPTTANFFSRVGGPYLNELWRELLDLPEDHPTATSFGKLKKAEKSAKLEALFSDDATRSAHGVTEAQAARIDAWLPEGMK